MTKSSKRKRVIIALAILLLLVAGIVTIKVDLIPSLRSNDEKIVPVTVAEIDQSDPLPMDALNEEQAPGDDAQTDEEANKEEKPSENGEKESRKTDKQQSTTNPQQQATRPQSSQPASAAPQGGQTGQPQQPSNTNTDKPSQPVHQHTWVAITEQKWVVDKAAYDEKVLVKEAWDETSSVAKEVFFT